MGKKKDNSIRQFSTGANRDTNEDKLDFEGFFSPVFMERFGHYMHKNRKLPNKKMRDSDNWQHHFGEGKQHYNVCMKSLWRHFLDLWMLHRGFKRYDNKDGHLLTKDEVCCAIFFNVQAYADKFLKDKLKKSRKEK